MSLSPWLLSCVSQHRADRFLYDVAYWVFVPLLLLNMVAGIILDR